METVEETLSELIPVKVTKSMMDEVTAVAGGKRKRAEYVRRLILNDRERARSVTKQAALAARVMEVVTTNPRAEPAIEAVLNKLTRGRLVPA